MGKIKIFFCDKDYLCLHICILIFYHMYILMFPILRMKRSLYFTVDKNAYFRN